MYNIAKNASIRYTFFELNYKYHLRTSYKNNVNSYFSFKFINKLAIELKNLITSHKNNLCYIQELQK